MQAEAVQVVFLGTRGTVPVERPGVLRYGGATVCVLVRMGGQTIVLDGGTGIMSLGHWLGEDERTVSILLTHSHLDHIMGLTSCPTLYEPQRHVCIYAAPVEGLSARGQLQRLMAPPLWPVGTDAFSAQVSFCDVKQDFMLGEVTVRVMAGAHPGGCTVYRLEHGEISLVFATDYELDEVSEGRLKDLARGCTLLLCDGQYTREELPKYRGYGHSDWISAAKLAADCGAGQLRILHHAPWRDDNELDAAGPQLRAIFANGAFAQIGEEMTL